MFSKDVKKDCSMTGKGFKENCTEKGMLMKKNKLASLEATLV